MKNCAVGNVFVDLFKISFGVECADKKGGHRTPSARNLMIASHSDCAIQYTLFVNYCPVKLERTSEILTGIATHFMHRHD
jgi:hypothetical protein